jgi:tetratricopeptide (TPR) repeat protein
MPAQRFSFASGAFLRRFARAFALAGLLWLCALVSFGQTPKADSLLNRLQYERNDSVKIELLFALAKILNPTHPRESFQYAEQAGAIARQIGYEQGKATALLHQSAACFRLGRYADLMRYADSAMKIFERSGNKKGYAQALNWVGNTRRNQGFYEDAVRLDLQSLKLREEINDLDGQAASLNNIANVYRSRKEYEKALIYYRKCLAIEIQRRILRELPVLSSILATRINCSVATTARLRICVAP